MRKQCMCMISFSFYMIHSTNCVSSFTSLLLVYNQRRCHGVQKRASRASHYLIKSLRRKKCVLSCFRHVFLFVVMLIGAITHKLIIPLSLLLMQALDRKKRLLNLWTFEINGWIFWKFSKKRFFEEIYLTKVKAHKTISRSSITTCPESNEENQIHFIVVYSFTLTKLT